MRVVSGFSVLTRRLVCQFKATIPLLPEVCSHAKIRASTSTVASLQGTLVPCRRTAAGWLAHQWGKAKDVNCGCGDKLGSAVSLVDALEHVLFSHIIFGDDDPI